MTEMPGGPLDSGSVEAVALLCARSLADPPTAAELRWVLGDAQPPVRLWGDPDIGVVAVAPGPVGAFLRLLVVDPAHRRRGHGRSLLAHAEAEALRVGAARLQVGAEAPWYLWPGVDTREIGMLCLLEQAKYERVDSAWNMGVDLRALPRDPGDSRPAGPGDRDEVESWSARHWAHWGPELVRALELGSLVVSRDDAGLAAACAYGVCRDRFVGPVAVRPDLLGRGVGQAVLVAALHRMRDAGHERAEISWVGPIRPYVRVGATVDRVFSIQRRALRG